MDALTILRLGSAMLGLGSLGLLLVRSSNPRLRGLGWLAAAFGCGFFGAGLLTLRSLPSLFTALLSDIAVLGGFVFLHFAVLAIMGQRRPLPRTSIILVSVLVVVDSFAVTGYGSRGLRLSTVSLLVALQCLRTALLLQRTARSTERAPGLFCSLILVLFSLFNFFRIAIVLSGNLYAWQTLVVTASYALYIAVALGLVFGFFWMSTTQLSVQLEHMASTDPLTRLYNRRTFLLACEKELATSHRRDRQFSILMIDLDHFKSINDRFGHQVGDAALVAAVESMQNSIRGSDVLARWGGEEFAALLPNADHEAAHIVAERLRANVASIQLPVELNGETTPQILRMTVSIGLATYVETDDIDTLMGRADRHLYFAKYSGRNRVLAAPPLARMTPAQAH